MKKNIIILVILSFLFIAVNKVNAESEYYEYIWSYEWEENQDMSGIIDSIDTSEGFLVVGFSDKNESIESSILYFDKSGKFVEKNSYEDSKLVKIIENNGYYYAFGISEKINGYIVLKLNSTGKIVKKLEVHVENEVHLEEDDAFYLIDYKGNFYIYDFWYYSVYYATIKIDNNIEDYTEIYEEDWDDETIEAVSEYYDLHRFYQKYIFDGTPASYEVTDSILYNGGFIVSNVDYDNELSYVYYEKGGSLVWKKQFDNVFIKCAIPFDDHIIISMGSWEDDKSSITVLDLDGNKLETDDLYNYYPKGASYYPEFFVELEKGFITASTKDDRPLATQLMYFSKKYLILTKIQGEGTISTSTVKSAEGEKVEFTVTPKEGYHLESVKVTDKNGNIIKFNDYTFTMPDADVTIEVTFIKKSIISNPETVDYVVVSVVILLVSVFAGLQFYKKIKY